MRPWDRRIPAALFRIIRILPQRELSQSLGTLRLEFLFSWCVPRMAVSDNDDVASVGTSDKYRDEIMSREIMRSKSDYIFMSTWDVRFRVGRETFIRDLRSNRRNEIAETAVDLNRRETFSLRPRILSRSFDFGLPLNADMMVSNCKLDRYGMASKENGIGECPITTDCMTSCRSANLSSESTLMSISISVDDSRQKTSPRFQTRN